MRDRVEITREVRVINFAFPVFQMPLDRLNGILRRPPWPIAIGAVVEVCLKYRFDNELALLGLWGDLSGKKDEGSGRMRA